MPIGSVEIALPAGGDLSVQPNGDLVLAADSFDVPLATQQRLIRLILTNPRLFDATGAPISDPDDKVNVDWGSGARAEVGEPTPIASSVMASHIAKALASDPTIATNPPPTVSVTANAGGSVTLAVTCYAITGEIITLPSLSLPSGA